MKILLSKASIVVAAVLACSSALAQGPSSDAVAKNMATQNKLFDEFFETGLRNNPMRATGIGDYRYNDKLGDFSLAQTAREHEESQEFLAKLRAIPTAGMPESDVISHQILERQLVLADAGYKLKNYEMPINMQGGIHTGLADLPLSMPFDSVKHYEDYIARLHQIPAVLDQLTEVLRAGLKDGLMPPKFLAEKLPAQCEGVITANPFVIPEKKYPASFTDKEKQRLSAEINMTLATEVFPAYKKLAAFLRDEYAPKGRPEIAIESLPQGKERYALAVKMMTTTDLTPAQIHEIGLKEVARITGEMTVLAKAQGFADLESFRKATNADPKWTPKSEQQILDDFKKYIDQMQPRLPELFGLLPKVPVTVEAIPSFNAGQATHYNSGTPDGKRAGRVVVAVSDPTHRSLVDDEAVAYHEGVPGHHLQISIAQSLTGLPKFRIFGGNSAYVEGWALYAEVLGKEVGFYREPVSDYGRLNSELFRAVRLVVDTGIHDKGWSRQQVIDYMHANDVNDVQAQSETDRYISWPGQALAYKIGQLKILELRAKAKAALGPRFDLKAFHDEILNGGALPLDVLDRRVTAWINGQMPQQAAK